MLRMQKMSSYGLSTPWNIDSSNSQIRFLRRQEGRLCVLRAIRLLKTSLLRLSPNRFFFAQNVENAIEWPFEIMKLRIIDITKVEFEGVQKADYEFSGSFAHLKHHLSDFTQVVSFDAKMQKMYSYGLLTLLNIASSTSSKSFFKTSRRHIMSLQVYLPT
jgi:exopolyphosphatase/pppGpp-phosphohydrolase